jgi:hypothetical protein
MVMLKDIDWDIVCSWIIIFVPGLLYLWLFFGYLRAVSNKRGEIQRVLSRGDAATRYIKAYGGRDADSSGKLVKEGLTPQEETERAEEIASRILAKNNYSVFPYLRAFGFTALIATIATIVAVTRIGLTTGLPSTLTAQIKSGDGVPAALAACAGGFVWSLTELLKRYRVEDMTPSAVYGTGVQLLVLAGVGPALSIFLSGQFTFAVAFGLGFLSLDAIADAAVQPTRRALNLPPSPTQVADPLIEHIDGLIQVRDRLSEAGISTVQQLAFTDPLRLLVRTNLDWKVILDLVDQSFLAVYVGSKIRDLSIFGVRGAVELANEPHDDATLTSIGEKLDLKLDEVKALIVTIKDDPTTRFIADLWTVG